MKTKFVQELMKCRITTYVRSGISE